MTCTLHGMESVNAPSVALGNAANLISVSRIALAPLTVWASLKDFALLAVAFLALAALSDFFDGRVARRRGTESDIGTFIDHGADVVFILTLISFGAYLSLIPWLLPALIAIAFLQYVFDNFATQHLAMRPSRLGRYNGIAYYVLGAFVIIVHCFASELETVLRMLAYGLVVTTILSIVSRATYWWRARKRASSQDLP